MSGNRSVKQHLIDSAVGITKVATGGTVVGVTTYAGSSQIIPAVQHGLTIPEIQAYATLIAAIFTALYFAAAFLLTGIKVVKEIKGKNTGG